MSAEGAAMSPEQRFTDERGQWDPVMVLRFIHEDEWPIANASTRLALAAARARIKAKLEVDTIKTTPRTLDAILWDELHGEAVAERLAADDLDGAFRAALRPNSKIQ